MNLSIEQRKHLCADYLARRQRARTDLFWLTNEVLSPPDSKIMTRATHGIITDHCQRFTGFKEAMSYASLRIVASERITPMYELEGERARVLLASRGHMKTSIQVIAHSIQWILNYPDVRILIATATDEKAQMIVVEMKAHFQFNPKLRYLFPEFCPLAKKVSDWGSKTEFTAPNRKRATKEPTVMTISVGKAMASTHHDVIKVTDAVTENNVRTQGQIQEVKDFFGYIEPLRERGESKDGRPNPGWLDVEGTIYDWNDHHQSLVDRIEADPSLPWKMTKQSCWIDKDKRISWWPERFPAEELDRIMTEIGPFLFASQYELNPVPPGEGLATKDDIKFFEHARAREMMARYTLVQTTVDLAGMNPNNLRADYTVFTTSGFQPDGRMDVLAIHRGRFSDDQVIEFFFMIQQAFPKNMKFKVQKDHLAVGLASGIRREMAKRGKWLYVEQTNIPNTETKKYRIKKSLQGWFKMGLIRFSDNIGSWERPTETSTALVQEILRFPKGAHDDILDTLADHMMDRDGDPTTAAIPGEKEEPRYLTCAHGPGQSCWRCLPDNPALLGREEPDMSDFYAEVTGI